MILRKPYAFLIKHFRFIHLVITGVLVYLALKCREVYNFFVKCTENIGNKYDALGYIDYRIYIFLGIGILLLFLVYWLLKYKDKPRNIYIFSIVGYVVVGIILLVVYSYLSGLVNSVIDQKTVMLFRDILFIVNLFQYYIIVVMLIRGMGFDIKKFNFSKDAQELNLSSEDGEEVEVNVGIDTTNIAREVRKQRREFGYFFQEFKIYIISIIIILVAFLGYRGYNYFKTEFKVYQQNEWFGYTNYIRVVNSYYDIDENNNYVVVKFDIYRNGKQEKLNMNNISLEVNGKKYVADKNICYKFNDKGNCYKQQYIGEESSSYILVYNVSDLNINESYLIYNESYDNSYKVKLMMEIY